MKILVNAPTGVQEVIDLGPGGAYFDLDRVLWDERTDGPMPDITLGGMVREGGILVYSQSRMDETSAALKPVERKPDRVELLVDLLKEKSLITTEDANTVTRS